MPNVFTVTEQAPVTSLLGGAAISLTESAPVHAFTGGANAAFAFTETEPVSSFSSKTGSFALVEEPPTTDISSYGPIGASFALTESAPTMALDGYPATTFALTERLPIGSFTGGRGTALAVTEQAPTFSLTGGEGDATVNASFGVTEQAPVMLLVSVLRSDAATTVSVVTEEPRALTEYDAWSVNVANRAHSGFTNYRYNSFFTFNGRDYGVCDDGVFELTGDDDDGSAIPVKAVWGITDLGTHYPKRFYRAFLTVRDRGGYVTVAAIMDEEERQTFSVDPSGRAGVQVLPIRLRRDMIGTEVAVEVANENGGDIDVPGLEILHQVLKRR